MSSYFIALIATAAAVLLRWLLDPLLGDDLPLVTLYGAVAIAVWFGGYRPALIAIALGYLAYDSLFNAPRGSFAPLEVRNLAGLFAYLITCSIIIGFGESMRTALRRAREQAELLGVTFASIGEAIITTDAAGLINDLNAMAQSLCGWTQEQAVGKPLGTVVRIVNEQTREPVEDLAERALREGVAVKLGNHVVLIARNGTERPIEVGASPIKGAGGAHPWLRVDLA